MMWTREQVHVLYEFSIFKARNHFA